VPAGREDEKAVAGRRGGDEIRRRGCRSANSPVPRIRSWRAGEGRSGGGPGRGRLGGDGAALGDGGVVARDDGGATAEMTAGRRPGADSYVATSCDEIHGSLSLGEEEKGRG
jgi:hypothetical protein